jgi:hypothetical protein
MRRSIVLLGWGIALAGLPMTPARAQEIDAAPEVCPYSTARIKFVQAIPDYRRSGYRPYLADRWPRWNPYRNYEIHPDVACSYLRKSTLYRFPDVVREACR